jgi:hypothetical protein
MKPIDQARVLRPQAQHSLPCRRADHGGIDPDWISLSLASGGCRINPMVVSVSRIRRHLSNISAPPNRIDWRLS